MKKRAMVWGLLLLMILSLFSGCKQVDAAGEAATPDEVVDTPVTEEPKQDTPMVVQPTETEPEQEDITEQPEQTEEPAEDPIEETPEQEEIKEPKPTDEDTETSEKEELKGVYVKKGEIIDYISIDEDFHPGILLVTIKEEYSSPDKQWTLNDFPTIDAKNIINLSPTINEDQSSCKNSLKIELTEMTKEATLSAAKELNQLDFIRGINVSHIIVSQM